MSAGIITWSQDMSSLGGATTVAIGVFDGVHLGHQALLRDAVADARARDVRAVAVTFDRDPDQVVSPSTAAPQLLTLADKLGCIAETGVDVILVVPFTHMLAEMAPESFVDNILLARDAPGERPRRAGLPFRQPGNRRREHASATGAQPRLRGHASRAHQLPRDTR